MMIGCINAVTLSVRLPAVIASLNTAATAADGSRREGKDGDLGVLSRGVRGLRRESRLRRDLDLDLGRGLVGLATTYRLARGDAGRSGMSPPGRTVIREGCGRLPGVVGLLLLAE